MAFDCILLLIHQPYGVNYNFTIKIHGQYAKYSTNMVICCISMAKLIIIFRTFFRYSKWNVDTMK